MKIYIFNSVDIGIKNIELQTYLQALLGNDLVPFLQSTPEPPAIRINLLKTSRTEFLRYLDTHGQKYRTIPFSPDGLILDRDDLPLSHSMAFFTGKFQYQGVASQLPVNMLTVKPGEKVLDMAASPGSKSTQLASRMQQAGILVLNDSSVQRMQPLNVNMQRSGAVNHYTLNLRGERLGLLYSQYFDKVLLDAPCTALGTLGENNEVRHWWRLAKLEKLAHIQDQLLISAFKSLKIGGEMVYATCSVAPEENELVVQRLIEKYPVSILPPPEQIAGRFDEGFTKYGSKKLHPDLSGAVRIFPHRHHMEGFFAIRLRKEDSFKNAPPRKLNILKTSDPSLPTILAVLQAISQTWGIDPDFWSGYRYLLTKARLWMTSREIETVPADHLVSAGLLLAEKKLAGWKLVTGSVQFLGKRIKKRCIELGQLELKRLFFGQGLPYRGDKEAYYILAYRGDPIASVYSSGSELKLRSSHRYRLIV